MGYRDYALAAALRLRKKPPAMHTGTAAPATMALPGRPETVAPAALLETPMLSLPRPIFSTEAPWGMKLFKNLCCNGAGALS